eukprot:CAMPEP_0113468170 /NCGR_PEP_ID=MMETSP0014_2-20120614/15212_1 /TAXON_ID=2857 /ORGANISM="Nitzschia sp." /LENGTH=982 /DNA_ID=CAMNT_0000360541 /DNA_START=213 /DNA_END=3161 /DNA_ORIENTATION=- /assembly_acc=CAM_ASM_000159
MLRRLLLLLLRRTTQTQTQTREAAVRQQLQQQHQQVIITRRKKGRQQGQGGERRRRRRSPHGVDPDPDPDGVGSNSNNDNSNSLSGRSSRSSGGDRRSRSITGTLPTVMAIFVVVVVFLLLLLLLAAAVSVFNNFSLLYRVTSSSSFSSSFSSSTTTDAVSSSAATSKPIPKLPKGQQQQEEEQEDPKTIFWKHSMKSLRESINTGNSDNNGNTDSSYGRDNDNKYVSLIMTRECSDLLLLLDTRTTEDVVTVEKIQDACHYQTKTTAQTQIAQQTQTQQNQEPRPRSQNQSLPLVVTQVRGEMGNHLGSLSHGIGIQLWLQRKYNLTTGLVILHQLVTVTQTEENNKSSQSYYRWVRHGNSVPTITTLRKCFPLLSNFNYELGMSLAGSPDTWIDGLILEDDFDFDGGDDGGDDVDTNTTSLSLLALARRIHNVNGANPQTWSSSRPSNTAAKSTTPTTKTATATAANIMMMDRRRVPVTPQMIDDGLKAAIELWNIRQTKRERRRGRGRGRPKVDESNGGGGGGGADNSNSIDNNNILLYSESLDNRVVATKYKRAFQTLFALDEQNPKCCIPSMVDTNNSNKNDNNNVVDTTGENNNHRAAAVEHLFHYRNFGLELLGVVDGDGEKSKSKSMNSPTSPQTQKRKQPATFEEVTPQQLYELLIKYYGGGGDIKRTASPNTTTTTTTTVTTTTTTTQQHQWQHQQRHRLTILTRRRSKQKDLDPYYEDPTLKEFKEYFLSKSSRSSSRLPSRGGSDGSGIQFDFEVNVVQGNSGVQDFCSIVQYLRYHDRNRGTVGGSTVGGGIFIGPQRSTFSEWGTILGTTAVDEYEYEYDDDDDDDGDSNNNNNDGSSKSSNNNLTLTTTTTTNHTNRRRRRRQPPAAILYAIHSNALDKQYSPYTLQFFDGERYDSNYAPLRLRRKSSSTSSLSMTMTTLMINDHQSVLISGGSSSKNNNNNNDDDYYYDDYESDDTSAIRRVLLKP